jgi:predicted DNA-binding transcriptional regulator AlpA
MITCKDDNTSHQNAIHTAHYPAVVNLMEAARITGTSRTTVLRLEKQGDFVPRVRLSQRRFGYRFADLINWIDSRREH